MGVSSEELQMMNGNKAQLIIDELQAEVERQKKLLEEKEREIDELKKKDGLDSVYDIIASLENYSTEEVLFYVAQVLAKVMNTNDVAIYTVANKEYARLFSATTAEARKLGNSIKYTDMGDMYDEMRNGRIYVNKTMAEGYPLMACAVYAEEEIRVMLMFWGIAPERQNLETANRLKVIKTVLQNTILRASRYMSSFRRKHYLEGTNVLKEDAFKVIIKTFFEAKARGLTECALIEFVMGYHNYESISIQIASSIRQTDFMGVMQGGKLYILLSNTDMKNAEIVQERLRKLGYESLLREAAV